MSGEFRPRCPPPTGLVRPVPVDPTGHDGPTRGQAWRARWRQTSRGFHVPAWVSDDVPEQRILEQSLRLGDGGAVTGWAACRLAGAAYFDGLESDNLTRRPVPLVVPRASRIRSTPETVVCREPLAAREIQRALDIPAVSPVRGLFDAMRAETDPREAVVALDMMAAAVLVSVGELRAYYTARRTWRRVRRVGWALDLADEDSLSPFETRMRLIWVLGARLPKPLVNRPVWDSRGRLLGVADLFDATAGVVGEYDGGTHRRPGRHASDVGREDLFRRAGLEYFKVTAVDMHEPGRVRERMLTTRARAPYLNGRSAGWTLHAPEGWRFTESASDILARRDWLRSLHESA